MATTDASSDPLAAGTAALQRGAWEEAVVEFERAAAAGDDPEALEGLATAAFFLDEGDLVLDARERAYAGYREAGRPVDAGRIAISLAWEYRAFRGEPAVGAGWLARARRLLEGCGTTREKGWLALREASFGLPADAAGARERCAEAEALARELGDVDLEMTAVALDGLVRVSQGDIAGGMARLDEAGAAATAGDMRDPIAIGFSCCYLIFACERVRDFDRAAQWCERLASYSADWNIRALQSVCRAHYGSVLVLRGEWARAEAEPGGCLPQGARVADAAPAPRVPPGPFALSEPGALEALAARAGLSAREAGEIATRWEYADLDTALRGILSGGPAVKAIEAAGEERVVSAVTDAITPFRTDDGRYVIRNTWRHLIATA